MGLVMKRVLLCAALAAAMGVSHAHAQSPEAATVWVGLEGGQDGFLLDETSGAVWMTGECLKRLEPAILDGTIWISRTAEMVSVGRMQALLDQTFRIDADPLSPSISVDNPARGGLQVFPDAVVRACEEGGCSDLASIPAC